MQVGRLEDKKIFTTTIADPTFDVSDKKCKISLVDIQFKMNTVTLLAVIPQGLEKII